MKTILKPTIYFILAILIAGCSTKFEPVKKIEIKPQYEKFDDISQANLIEVRWEELEGFREDDLKKAYDVFVKGCEKSAKFELLKKSCETTKYYSASPEYFFKQNFVPFKLYDDENRDTGIITGYYEPLLIGSRIKTERFKYPIYKTPNDLITVNLNEIYPELSKYRLRGRIAGNSLVPYYERGKIKEDETKDVIAYVDDKVDLYFLHIQGSGRVLLTTGEIINIGYANQNGRVYTSTGKYMIQNNLLTNYGGSMQGMKKWFDDNPSKIDEILNINESYVFFQESNKTATGALGVPLVAKRNLAVDRSYIPLGLPVFINTQNPISKKPISKLMVAADVGGAIKGQIRADFYWGYGKDAGEIAGKMKEQGELFVLLPKDYFLKNRGKNAYNK